MTKNKYFSPLICLFFLGLSILWQGCKNADQMSKETTDNTYLKEDTISPKGEQLIVVLTENWDTNHCEIYLCEKKNDIWSVSFPAIRGVTGKSGLAWGIGLHNNLDLDTIDAYKAKAEGDMKSPAGIFNIGPFYGYADSLPFLSSLKYIKSLETFHGVDDPDSKYYNQIIDTEQLKGNPEEFYSSYEIIRRKDNMYKWFFRIQHNPENFPLKGSLIFFHIWRNESSGTAGCIASSEEAMLKILKWLNPEYHPKIIILPKHVYQICQKSGEFPEIISNAK